MNLPVIYFIFFIYFIVFLMALYAKISESLALAREYAMVGEYENSLLYFDSVSSQVKQ